MTSMDPTLLLFACIALGAAAVFFVVLAIVAMKAGRDLDRMTTVVEAMRADVGELKAATLPVITKAGEVLDETKDVLVRTENDLAKLSNGAAHLAGIAEDLRQLEQKLVARVQPSLEELASLVSGVAKGVTTFARKVLDR